MTKKGCEKVIKARRSDGSSSCPWAGSRALHGWRTGTPRAHPHRTWRSTRDSASHRSSERRPYPVHDETPRQRQRQSGPYTKLYNLPNKSMLITRQLSILQQQSAFRFLLIIESRQPHTSSAPPHFIVHRPRNAFRIVLLHTWPKNSTLVDH